MFTRFSVETAERAAMVRITEEVRRVVRASGVSSGVCHVYVPHTTAAVAVNEGDDPAVVRDVLTHLDKSVPWGASYEHREGNSAAHVKAALVGHAATVFVENGDLALGTWQAIFFCEFDGPRRREVWVKVSAG
jgi:secondary thiamine-phosphate synthase enzyme